MTDPLSLRMPLHTMVMFCALREDLLCETSITVSSYSQLTLEMDIL
ncbi:Bgt-50420 [Blumeria graminis f. sp. tritici]|uniref:Bgt-50420 n=1 Tax=Blumeria graminis f. sp. tritici TaxID=62690 RepID=A0A9X9PSK6_BLUGR|nr:Bgt-50420 [Blumeria graminis f. sp. tritici]